MSEWFFPAWFALIITLNAMHYWRAYRRYPTFDQYKSRHPNMVRYGRCTCFRCGNHRVLLHNLGPFRRRHVCATCSTVLYRG